MGGQCGRSLDVMKGTNGESRQQDEGSVTQIK